MKKGRPGTVVHVLVEPAMVESLRDVLRATTGSLGVRVSVGERWPAARSTETVWVDGQMIRVKVSAGRVKAEYEDVALAARRTGQPLRELAFRAEAQWRAGPIGPTGAVSGSGSEPELHPVDTSSTGSRTGSLPRLGTIGGHNGSDEGDGGEDPAPA
jgi:hypothetical protein